MTQLGPYTIKELIGEGSMGRVYRGVYTESSQPVAIKHLKPDIIAKNPTLLDRFHREGEALRHLNHPHIVQMLDAFEHDGGHYLVMDFVAGGSLYEELKQTPQLPIQRALAITRYIAGALDAAHSRNIIHRDLKPANILLTPGGIPLLTDFGLAYMSDRTRVTYTDALIGTDAYLSPEACYSLEPDPRTDIWSLGVVLFEMLAGTRPFGGGKIGAIVTAILTRDTPNLLDFRPDAPRRLVTLVSRMLEKDREFRIGTAQEVIAALLKIAEEPDAPVSVILDAASVDQTRHNLPTLPTSFVGRESDIREILALLDNPDCRLVTLVGAGGMGKTRLSLEVARRLLAQTPLPLQGKGPGVGFANDVWFVPLQAVSDGQSIESAIATHVNFQFYGQGTQREQLLNYFRAKHLLLVLDNFEHVLDGADLVTDILAAAPDVQIIATSREILNLSDEWLYDVHGMDIPDSDSHIEDYSAVQLFMQRAQRVKRGFSLQNERDCVRRILSLVEGMPLGIELAAAWLKRLPCQRIADEIAHNLDFLTTQTRDAEERHRSMRAVFDHSWGLLSDEERDALMRVSVFQGGFTEDAAREVTGASFWTLVALVDKSLLRMDEHGRYDMHRLLQQYAAEHLGSQPDIYEMTHDHHCDHYLGFVARHGVQIRSVYYQRTLADIDDIQMAWRWAIDQTRWNLVESCLEPLTLFLDFHARFWEADTMVNLVLDALVPDTDSQRHILGLALFYSGFCKTHLEKLDHARSLVQQAVALLRQIEPGVGLACAVRELARHNQGATDIAEIADMLKESQAICRRVGSHYHLAVGMFYEGFLVHVPQSAFAQTRQCYLDALVICEEYDYRVLTGFVLNNLGNLERLEGNIEEAVEVLKQALAIWPSDRVWPYAQNLHTLALSEVDLGDVDAARQHYLESLAYFEDIGWNSQLAGSSTDYGLALWRWGDYEEARQLLGRALSIKSRFR